MEEPPTKKSKTDHPFQSLFNSTYLSPEKQNELKQQMGNAAPFPYLQIKDFITDKEFIEELSKEVAQQEFNLRSLDLYDFYQSGDLNQVKTPAMSKFQQLLTDSELHRWLENISGVENISPKVDISSSIYSSGSYLQCHDDKLEGRRIAYIYYLVGEDWSEKDGGELSLFEAERDGVPKQDPFVKIVPVRNSLVIFQVSVNSFHRVEEVISEDGRFTIGGWFHGPPIPYPPTPEEPKLPFQPMLDLESDLSKWINPLYLKDDTQKSVQEQFSVESQISLGEFLLLDRFKELREEVEKVSEWKTKTPPNRQYFLYLGDDSDKNESVGPKLLLEFLNFLKSKTFSALLEKLTGLECKSFVGELQKFDRGHYTLMHDQEPRRAIDALDCYLYLIDPSHEWEEDFGGFVNYNDDSGELLTIVPAGNTLSLVYCDKNTSRFTKYLNHHVTAPLYNAYLLYSEEENPGASSDK